MVARKPGTSPTATATAGSTPTTSPASTTGSTPTTGPPTGSTSPGTGPAAGSTLPPGTDLPRTGSPRTGSLRPEPCEVADEVFDLRTVPPPSGLISIDRVRGAGSLLLSYLYCDRLRFCDAVDRARELLDTDRICLDGPDDQALLNRLYCRPELEDRVSAATRRRLVAKVLGIPNPDVPEGERDTAIQPMLVRLLDGINAVCDPGPFRDDPTPFSRQRLDYAAFAVQAQLSRSMTGLVTMQVRDLQRQTIAAQTILEDLASRLQLPCRPGVTVGATLGAVGRDPWGPLEALVGEQLRADGVDLFEAADIADAWRVVFEFLAGFTGRVGVSTESLPTELLPAELCQAAAVLRTPASGLPPDLRTV